MEALIFQNIPEESRTWEASDTELKVSVTELVGQDWQVHIDIGTKTYTSTESGVWDMLNRVVKCTGRNPLFRLSYKVYNSNPMDKCL